jgi:hypothetical protein
MTRGASYPMPMVQRPEPPQHPWYGDGAYPHTMASPHVTCTGWDPYLSALLQGPRATSAYAGTGRIPAFLRFFMDGDGTPSSHIRAVTLPLPLTHSR